MKFVPRPYQTLMLDHVNGLERCALWAGMGLGKTVTTLTAIADAQELVGERGPTLVLAPLRVAQQVWPDEREKWSHLHSLEISPIVGDPTARRKALRRDANVYTMNYENIPWLVEELDGKWPFVRVVADESTRLKSFRLEQGGIRAQALGKVAHKTGDWVNLTGTPSPNGLQDLWGQTWFLDSGERLGRTFTAFIYRWFQRSFDGYGVEPLPSADWQIHDKIRDITLSIDARDWFDIKKPIESVIEVELPTKARKHYKEMEKKLFTVLAGNEIEAFNAASRTMKCLQLASGAAYIDEKRQTWEETHDRKLEALGSIVSEAAGMPVLVSYFFQSSLKRILREFSQARELDDKPQTVRDWNAGKIPVLVAHPATAGHGLNLQDGGNIIVYFDHWWDLEQHAQILERIGPTRQMQSGHDRPVFVYYIVARDTVDELVLHRLRTKAEVQDILLEAMRKGGCST